MKHLIEYGNVLTGCYNQPNFAHEYNKAFELLSNIIKNKGRLFFIGNGGSHATMSHMMLDFAKTLRVQTFAFSDPSMMACFSNDYGWENSIVEWLDVHLESHFVKDMLIVMSSSGMSPNLINAMQFFKKHDGLVIGLSSFSENNLVRLNSDVSLYVPTNEYGFAECTHQTIIHSLLDELIGVAKN